MRQAASGGRVPLQRWDLGRSRVAGGANISLPASWLEHVPDGSGGEPNLDAVDVVLGELLGEQPHG
jgi:hypothetical protein